jgi:hypothetical protein
MVGLTYVTLSIRLPPTWCQRDTEPCEYPHVTDCNQFDTHTTPPVQYWMGCRMAQHARTVCWSGFHRVRSCDYDLYVGLDLLSQTSVALLITPTHYRGWLQRRIRRRFRGHQWDAIRSFRRLADRSRVIEVSRDLLLNDTNGSDDM